MITGLEILSRYLSYRLNVETPKGKGIVTRVEISVYNGEDKPWFYVHGKDWYEPKDLKPILYAFEDLTATINGIVPAVEIAKLAVGFLNVGDFEEPFSLPHIISVRSKDEKYEVLISRDFDIDFVHKKPVDEDDKPMYVYNQAAIQQFLLQQHFAVGLNPHEYIRKEVAP